MSKLPFAFAVMFLSARWIVAGDSSLTIYNRNFAVLREVLPVTLREGVNDLRFANVAKFADPNSVVLRDRSGKAKFDILEQRFRGDAPDEDALLSNFEGQTIDFERVIEGKRDIVQGTVIRAGRAKTDSDKAVSFPPIVEVAGKVRFDLPGTPLFPRDSERTWVTPEFNWKISAPKPVQFDAEVAYTSYGINWYADYNVVAAEGSEELQAVGWITVDNQSGKRFENAKLKVVAGLIGKLDPRGKAMVPIESASTDRTIVTGSEIQIPHKELEDYYSYTYPKTITIDNRETLQLEFLRAEGIQSKRIYLYDGVGGTDLRPQLAGAELNPQSGVDSYATVAVVREFKNSAENHLGVPLPGGRMRHYRRASDQQIEFVGENDIGPIAKDETVEAIIGTAFDLVVQRVRTNFDIDLANHLADESFEIKLRNRKNAPVEIRVVEHLFRWHVWEITAKSDEFKKKDASTMEFTIPVKPGEERILSYKVRYNRLPANASQAQ